MFDNVFSSPLPFILGGLALVLLAVVVALVFRRTSTRNAKLRHMANEIEKKAWELSGQASLAVGIDGRDLRAYLASLNDALDRLLVRQHNMQQHMQREALQQSQQETEQGHYNVAPAIQKLETPRGPSTIAKAIMNMRDHMLLARPKEGETMVSVEVLDVFYQELGAILAQEEVVPLEKTGEQYDQEKQMMVDTQGTEDPAQHNIVCKTESPGYMFHERLLRPQEVVVYKFRPAA